MTEQKSGRRGRWAVPLGDFVGALVEPALARQGFGEASLVTDWPVIVGARIAKACEPIKLQWPPRAPKRDPDAPPEPATLVLRVEGGFALEAQHQAALIVERVNAHLGWNCVGRLAFRQGPLERTARGGVRKAAPSAQAIDEARAAVAPIEAEDLREALVRLGAQTIDRAKAAGKSVKETKPRG